MVSSGNTHIPEKETLASRHREEQTNTFQRPCQLAILGQHFFATMSDGHILAQNCSAAMSSGYLRPCQMAKKRYARPTQPSDDHCLSTSAGIHNEHCAYPPKKPLMTAATRSSPLVHCPLVAARLRATCGQQGDVPRSDFKVQCGTCVCASLPVLEHARNDSCVLPRTRTTSGRNKLSESSSSCPVEAIERA